MNQKRTNRIVNLILSIIVLGIISIMLILTFHVYNFLSLYKTTEVASTNLEGYDPFSEQDATSVSVEQESLSNEEVITNPYANALLNETSQQISTKKENRFYYNQLDDNAKTLYNGIYDNKTMLKTGQVHINFGTEFNALLNQSSGDILLNNAYQEAWNSFLMDNPDIFYIDVTKIYLLMKSTTKSNQTTYDVSITLGENINCFSKAFQSEAEVEEAISKVENMKKEIMNSLNGSTYEKIKYIHDWLVDNVEYDRTLSRPNTHNVYGTLIEKNVVCEGYAKTFKYLLDELDIPCILVVGDATNSEGKTESHAWNYLKLDNSWYGVDATWDDPIIIGNGRINDTIKYKYFLKSVDTFLVGHKATGKLIETGKGYTYPDLSKTDYIK